MGTNGLPFDVSTYAYKLQSALRRLEGGNWEEWQALVERGLGEAYAQQDALGLVAMVQVVINFLDATGHHDRAVTEINHAIQISRGDPRASAVLAALRGCCLAVQGKLDDAVESVVAAEHAAQSDANFQNTIEYPVHITAVRMVVLGELSTESLDRLVHPTSDEARDSDSLFLASYQIPYLHARGERFQAAPRLRAFRLAAQAARHEYRLADASVFAAADGAVTDPGVTVTIESLPQWNWLARWRAAVLRFRAAHLIGSAAEAEKEMTALLKIQRAGGKADLDGLGGFPAYHVATTGGGQSPVELDVPDTVHLLNLPAVLAGAEAVAVAGSQVNAARWLDWLDEHLPLYIHTSLEWPVSRARVQALLALRSQDLWAASGWFERAVAWAQDAGYPCELATAQIQSAELQLHHSGSPGRIGATFRAQRQQGWDALRARGIDPARPAYDVARLSAWTRDYVLHPRLTPRELEVLALLADELTYNEIAARLGVRRATIHALVHRGYAKLGASGKASAVQAARRLGIL